MARSADPGLAERRRSQIIDAALSCFRRRGFHQSSMQQICAEARLSPGAVYRYFSSKTDIIAAIAEDDRREAARAFSDVSGAENLIEALCLFARGFVDLAAENGDAPLIADVMSEALRDRAFAARIVKAGTPLERRLAAAIQAGVASGAFAAEIEPARAARIILGSLDGLCLRACVRGDKGAAIAADVRAALESLLRPRSTTRKAARRRVAGEIRA